MKKQHNNLL